MWPYIVLIAFGAFAVGLLTGRRIYRDCAAQDIADLKARIASANEYLERAWTREREAIERCKEARAREDDARKSLTRLMDSVLAKNQMAPVSEPVAPIKPTAEEKRPLTWREKKKALEERFGKLPIEEQLKIANSHYVYQEKKEG